MDDEDQPCYECGEPGDVSEYPTYGVRWWGGERETSIIDSVWYCYNCAKRAGREH